MLIVNRSDLPPLLKELDFLHSRLDPLIYKPEDFGAFNRSLRLCTEGFGNSSDKNHQAQLATHWLNRFHYLLSHASTNTLPFPSHQMEVLVSIIINHGFIDEIVANANYARILANLALRKINLRYEFDLGEEGAMDNLLAKWATELPKEVLKSTPCAVDFIYGKGAWDLYAPDVPANCNVAQHFWNIGLPVQGQLNQKNIMYVTIPTIPQDMF